MKRYFLIPIAIVLLSSCNLVRTIGLLKKGDTGQAHFKKEIPFELRAGIIFIKVVIEKEEYTFIFDSGATNAVSFELAEKLRLKPHAHQKAVDFEGKSRPVNFSSIQNIAIGKIDFENTGCAIIDLKEVPEVRCLGADGLIGANLMKEAVWQIDYKNRKLIVADNIDSLQIPAGTPCIPFVPLLSGTPAFKANINGIETGKNIFDTGSSGEILFVKKDLDKLNALEEAKPLKTVRGTGSRGTGLYGRKIDTTFISKLQSVKAGTLEIGITEVEFKETDMGNFGSGFLKDYMPIFDWTNKKVWLVKPANAPDRKHGWTDFGFVPAVKEGKMLVSYVWDGSPAQLSGIRLDDQIISANSIDYSSISEEKYCEMVLNRFEWKTADTLDLVIRSGEQGRKVKLARKNIYE